MFEPVPATPQSDAVLADHVACPNEARIADAVCRIETAFSGVPFNADHKLREKGPTLLVEAHDGVGAALPCEYDIV
jgi:hypothetical protein